MDNLIERYIYDVTRRLEESKRSDIENELRSNIYDMLSESPTEDEIINVLKKLGKPSELSLEYKDKKRYLISPRYFDDYIKVLKIVLIIFIGINVFGAVIQAVFNATDFDIIPLFFSHLFEGLMSSMFFGFSVVTLVFYILDQNTDKIKFDPKILPKVPQNKGEKSRRYEGIFELIMIVTFGTLFISFLVINYLNIDINVSGQIYIYTGHLLDNNFVMLFLPLISISFLIALGHAIYKIVKTRTTLKVFMVYSILDFITLFLMTVLVFNQAIFRTEFIDTISNLTDQTTDQITFYIHSFVRGFFVFAWIMFIIEQVTEYLRFKKKA